MRHFLCLTLLALLSSVFVGVAYGAVSLDKGTYTWTDKVHIRITEHGLDSDRTSVKIYTSNHQLNNYKLSKAGNGLYVGEITLTGFLHDVDGDGRLDTNPRTMGTGSNNGFLESQRDDELKISIRFGDGDTITKSAKIRWNVGTIDFDMPRYPIDETSSVQVTDPDLNLNPQTLDRIKISISSDSDKAGILINAIETAKESGIFNATISFVQDSASSGDRLFAVPVDSIYARYEDRTLPSLHSVSGDLKIEDSAEVYSPILSTERMKNSAIFFSDSNDNPLQSFSPDTAMQIVGTITNEQKFMQKFVYLIQIIDDDNYIESISWIQGEMLSVQSMNVSTSLTPKKSGEYRIETFIWKSLTDPTALSLPMSEMITVE